MKLLDTNVWLALTLKAHVFHEAGRQWFRTEAREEPVLFCRATQQSYLRLLTTESVMRGYGLPAMSNANAWGEIERLLADSRVKLMAEPPGLEGYWRNVTTRHSASPKIWMDAYLAAFAVAGKYQFVTTDKAFSQYPGLELHLITL